jgi:membrane-anchored mycosin MYCP
LKETPGKEDIQMVQSQELSHQPDQLVVDLGSLPAVEAYLSELEITCNRPIEADQSLGLARLAGLSDWAGAGVDLDTILGVLRQHFGRANLVIGKNRYVDSVVGVGHKPMAAGEPQVVNASDVPLVDVPASAGTGVRIGIVDTPFPQPAADRIGPVSMQAGHSLLVVSLIRRQAPMATTFLNGTLDGATGRADSWDVARAMMQLTNHEEIDILHLSLGSYATGGPPLVISRAIERLSPHVLVVAAAGNHGASASWRKGRNNESVIYPAGIDRDNIISVGADEGAAGSYPDFNPGLTRITCTAQGVDIVGHYVDADVMLSNGPVQFTGFARWDGTSFAAATVSGAVAARMTREGVSAKTALDHLLTEGKLVRPFPPAP